MELFLKKIEIENFKGIKKFSLKFDKNTTIQGRNETGKTSLLDAYTWLLFGKNNQFKEMRTQVLTLDFLNKRKYSVITKVTGLFEFDGKNICLEKQYSEIAKTNKKGELKINSLTRYFINDEPFTFTNYKNKIAEIVNEKDFQLLSFPLYFSENLKWTERREILSDLANNIKIEDVLNKPQFDIIKEDVLMRGYDSCLKIWKTQLKNISDEVKSIPIRIDEVSKNVSNFSNIDEIMDKKESLEAKIEDIKNKKNNQQAEKLKAVNELIVKKFDIDKEISKELAIQESIERNEKSNQFEIDNLIKKNNLLQSVIDEIETHRKDYNESRKGFYLEMEQARNEWKKYNGMNESPEIDNICPACGQELPAEQIKSSFDKWKKNQLNNCLQKAEQIKKRISYLGEDNFDKTRENNVNQIKANYEKIKELKKNKYVFDSEMLIDLKERKNAIQNQIDIIQLKKEIDYLPEIKELQENINKINSDLSLFEESNRAKKRIKELEFKLSEEVKKELNLKNKLDKLSSLNLSYMEAVSNAVNSLFSDNISFKLFEEMKNGDFKDICDVLVMSKEKALVAYPEVNTAGKINAGIEIINKIQQKKKEFVPIWIDNTESVDEVFQAESQMILLEKVKEIATLTKKEF